MQGWFSSNNIQLREKNTRKQHGCCKGLMLQNVVSEASKVTNLIQKFDGISTSNACFVVALAYLKNRVEQLNKSILVFD